VVADALEGQPLILCREELAEGMEWQDGELEPLPQRENPDVALDDPRSVGEPAVLELLAQLLQQGPAAVDADEPHASLEQGQGDPPRPAHQLEDRARGASGGVKEEGHVERRADVGVIEVGHLLIAMESSEPWGPGVCHDPAAHSDHLTGAGGPSPIHLGAFALRGGFERKALHDRPPERGGAKIRLTRKLVLVVDDDPDIRTLSGSFSRARTTGQGAWDGPSALQAMEQESPEVVLLDMLMPGLSGDEVLDLLDKLEGHPPVVIMTAGKRARNSALLHHNPFYLAKPFDAATLLATVEVAQEGAPRDTRWTPEGGAARTRRG